MKKQKFRVIAELDRDEKPRKLFADDLRGQRVEVKPGSEFTAVLAEDYSRERTYRDGRIIKAEPTGFWSVVESDCDIAPGCLTSLIRTERAVPIAAAVEVA